MWQRSSASLATLLGLTACGVFQEKDEPAACPPAVPSGQWGSVPLAGSTSAGSPGGAPATNPGSGGANSPPAGGGGSGVVSGGGAPPTLTAGAGGTSAQGGNGSVAAAGTFSPPKPPYTFPQNKRSSFCTYPALADHERARESYERWKTELVTSDGANGFARVRRPANEEDTTVSEGIAYGMILAVTMGDQTLFDDFWKYSRQPGFLTDGGLMHWKILPNGEVAGDGRGAATDADEDMAWALILADKKWGGRGSLEESYLDAAKAQIQRIWDREVDHGRGELLLAGDSWGPTVAFNPSYFAPNQYRAFGKLTGKEDDWKRVIDKGYETLEKTLNAQNGNQTNGLVPAWGVNDDGTPAAPWNGAPTNYQYDSARIPFRIGQDYCEYGEPRAKAYLDKITPFFVGVGASNIKDGYNLDGTVRAENPDAQAALFVGAAAVGAMSDPKYRPFLEEAYGLLVTKEMLPPSYYFNLSWEVFSLLMLSGNLFDYTLHP